MDETVRVETQSVYVSQAFFDSTYCRHQLLALILRKSDWTVSRGLAFHPQPANEGPSFL